MLINDQGETAWFKHEEGRVELYTNSFDEFLAKYAEFVTSYDEVFDSYSAVSPTPLRLRRRADRESS